MAKLEEVKSLLNDAAKIKDAEIDAAKTLLDAASPIYNEKLQYQKQKLENGEFFNIFDVLGRRDDETKGHSAFLATLLDPAGPHSCGAKFLEAFCKVVCDDFGFDCENACEDAYVVKEEYLGNKSEDGKTGGYIDIAIHQKGDKKVIAIENKIWAGDQETQLLRYSNFCKKYGNGNWRLLYLTLDGHEPSDWSTNGELEKGKDYFTISYATHISRWLESCKEIAKGKAGVLSSIEQYSNLIEQLTKQNEEDKMDEKIIDLLLEGNNLEVAEELASKIDDAKIRLLEEKVKPLLKEKCGITDFDENFCEPFHDEYIGFEFRNKNFGKFFIRFEFNEKDLDAFDGGICGADPKPSKKIQDIFRDNCKNDEEQNEFWLLNGYLNDYSNWRRTSTLLSIINKPEKFCNFINDKIERYRRIIKDALKAEEATAPKKQK